MTARRIGSGYLCALLVALMMPACVFAGPNDFWAASNGTSLVKIDKNTGASTSFAPHGYDAAYSTAWSGGSLYTTYYDYDTALWGFGTFDTTTGAITAIASGLSVANLYGLETDNSGTMYAMSYGNTSMLYEINTSTGAATEIGSTGHSYMIDMAFEESTGTMWGVDGSNLYTIDTSTGDATFQAAITDVSGLKFSIAFDALGTLYLGSYDDPAGFYTVNTTTGEATLVGNPGAAWIIGGDFEPQAIPLPSAAWLTFVGLGGVFIVRRRLAA